MPEGMLLTSQRSRQMRPVGTGWGNGLAEHKVVLANNIYRGIFKIPFPKENLLVINAAVKCESNGQARVSQRTATVDA